MKLEKKVQNRVHKTYNMLVCHVDNCYCIIIYFFRYGKQNVCRAQQRSEKHTVDLSCVFRHVTHDERCSVPICTAKPPSPCVVYHVFLELHSTTRTFTTRTHTLPYEYTYANPSTGRYGDSRSHQWRLVVEGNVAYHLTHNR
jgi:hypothetical protein